MPRTWSGALALVALAATGFECPVGHHSAPGDPMLDRDVTLLGSNEVLEIPAGTPAILPGPDGELGTDDDVAFGWAWGDVDLVIRGGITAFSGPFAAHRRVSQRCRTATAEPFGEGTPLPFVVARVERALLPRGRQSRQSALARPACRCSRSPSATSTATASSASLTSTATPSTLEIEEEELRVLGRRFAPSSGGRASGELFVERRRPARRGAARGPRRGGLRGALRSAALRRQGPERAARDDAAPVRAAHAPAGRDRRQCARLGEPRRAGGRGGRGGLHAAAPRPRGAGGVHAASGRAPEHRLREGTIGRLRALRPRARARPRDLPEPPGAPAPSRPRCCREREPSTRCSSSSSCPTTEPRRRSSPAWFPSTGSGTSPRSVPARRSRSAPAAASRSLPRTWTMIRRPRRSR